MAGKAAKDAYFAISTGTSTSATLKDISGFLRRIRGLPGRRELREATAFGDSGFTFIPTLENVRFTLDGYFDSQSTGSDPVIGGLRGASSAVSFAFGPEGSGASAVKYSGSVWIESYEIDEEVQGIALFTAEMQVNGVVTRGTFT